MPTTTFRVGTPSTSNTANYASGSFAPAVGDLLVVFAVFTGNAGAVSTASVTESVGQTGFSRIDSALFTASANAVMAFVANSFSSSTASRTVTFHTNGGNATGCTVIVYSISGMLRTGLDAIRQDAEQPNLAAGTTPAPVFTNACLTGNVTLGVVGNTSNPATITPPTSWTEDLDTGYSTPTCGAESVHRDSGFTGTTITWGSAGSTGKGVITLELDSSNAVLPVNPEGLVVQANINPIQIIPY